jgi:hypothetical protein
MQDCDSPAQRGHVIPPGRCDWRREAGLTWNGRKKKKGEIDEENWILFHSSIIVLPIQSRGL